MLNIVGNDISNEKEDWIPYTCFPNKEISINDEFAFRVPFGWEYKFGIEPISYDISSGTCWAFKTITENDQKIYPPNNQSELLIYNRNDSYVDINGHTSTYPMHLISSSNEMKYKVVIQEWVAIKNFHLNYFKNNDGFEVYEGQYILNNKITGYSKFLKRREYEVYVTIECVSNFVFSTKEYENVLSRYNNLKEVAMINCSILDGTSNIFIRFLMGNHTVSPKEKELIKWYENRFSVCDHKIEL